MPKLNSAEFESSMKRIAKEFAVDPHHRLRSWDHANRHWQDYVAGRAPDPDHAALHLAFYLASFGMYRGSSDLLFRDYKVLVPAVEFLKQKAANAWADRIFSKASADALADQLKQLADEVWEILLRDLARPGKKRISVSDTLISKILVVTLGCVPAFDTQVKAALGNILGRNYRSVDGFSKSRMIATIQLAQENRSLIESGRAIIAKGCEIKYPLIRIFDLYLWHHGARLITKTRKSNS